MVIRPKPDTCRAYADRLVDFSDGELAADERMGIEVHVASCPGCRAALARLDSSRNRLLNGMSSTRVELPPRAPFASRRSLQLAATAAIVVICFTTPWVIGLRTFVSTSTNVAQLPAPVETIAVPKLTQHEALWQIALVEQQARLQTSLDLWPEDESYDEQRERNRRLVATFQSLTETALPDSVQ